MKVDGNRFRANRFKIFKSLAQSAAAMSQPVRILDVGGTASYWRGLSSLWCNEPWDITIVNLGTETFDDGKLRVQSGDARSLPQFENQSFDIVHSNSVIEHVGAWPDMQNMAEEVRRIGRHYYVQTPNLWFPIEPHYRAPFFALLPQATRARVLMKRRLGFRGPCGNFHEAMLDIQSVQLLNAAALASLFPDARIMRERFALMTKSLIAIR